MLSTAQNATLRQNGIAAAEAAGKRDGKARRPYSEAFLPPHEFAYAYADEYLSAMEFYNSLTAAEMETISAEIDAQAGIYFPPMSELEAASIDHRNRKIEMDWAIACRSSLPGIDIAAAIYNYFSARDALYFADQHAFGF